MGMGNHRGRPFNGMPGEKFRCKIFLELVKVQDEMSRELGRPLTGADVVQSRIRTAEYMRVRPELMRSIEDEGIKNDWLTTGCL